MTLPDAVYSRLLRMRTGLRHFERWSDQQARAAGLTPAQHQLLLAIRGHDDPRGPTIGELADYLLLHHNSTVGLIDRADAADLVQRTRDGDDHRIVRLQLTDTGAERLEGLSALHLEELKRLAPQLPGAWEGLGPVQRTHGLPGSPPSTPETTDTALTPETPDTTLTSETPDTTLTPVTPEARERPATVVEIGRVYDHPTPDPRSGVLVDRLWPRGLARAAAPFETWSKDVAPSAALRKWYGHLPQRFEEFARRYREELAERPSAAALDQLRRRSQAQPTVLLTATKDLEHSGAAVLQEVLAEGGPS